MTNKEFQDILAQYPDDYEIQLDNAFGWEVPSNKNKVDPHLYVNTDCGFIEIEPPECRDLWITEIPSQACMCVAIRADNHIPLMAGYVNDSKHFLINYGPKGCHLEPISTFKKWFILPENYRD